MIAMIELPVDAATSEKYCAALGVSPPPLAAIMNGVPNVWKKTAAQTATTSGPATAAMAMLFAVLMVLACRSSPPTNVDQYEKIEKVQKNPMTGIVFPRSNAGSVFTPASCAVLIVLWYASFPAAIDFEKSLKLE